LISYNGDELNWEIEAPLRGYLSFIDNWDKGWKAFVDGVETKIYRADYAFRSVYLEPGDHTVVMRYVPAALRVGLIVTLLAALVVAALWAFPVRAGPESDRP
jgi:uncharacterized membrane protein YfhO